MAVTLVATAGATNANAYCDLADANTYHDMRYHNDDWANADDANKERLLMWATRLLDQLDFDGSLTTQTQALRWPRAGCTDREGRALDSSTIPQVIKDACAEWAFQLLLEDRTLDEGGLVEVGGKVGPVTNPQSYKRKPIPDAVREILSKQIFYVPGYGKVFRV